MNIRRGLARIAHDQAEHLTTPAILVQNELERRRITRLVILCIEFVSFPSVFGFDFSLSLLTAFFLTPPKNDQFFFRQFFLSRLLSY
jgi:hypothetical protein